MTTVISLPKFCSSATKSSLFYVILLYYPCANTAHGSCIYDVCTVQYVFVIDISESVACSVVLRLDEDKEALFIYLRGFRGKDTGLSENTVKQSSVLIYTFVTLERCKDHM